MKKFNLYIIAEGCGVAFCGTYDTASEATDAADGGAARVSEEYEWGSHRAARNFDMIPWGEDDTESSWCPEGAEPEPGNELVSYWISPAYMDA